MIDHLLDFKSAVSEGKTKGLSALLGTDHERFLKAICGFVYLGYSQNLEALVTSTVGPNCRGRRKKSKARGLLDRFRDYPHHSLAFTRDWTVPLDNTPAERDLRMTSLRQKISSMFRDSKSLTNLCLTRGSIAAARKKRTLSV